MEALGWRGAGSDLLRPAAIGVAAGLLGIPVFAWLRSEAGPDALASLFLLAFLPVVLGAPLLVLDMRMRPLPGSLRVAWMRWILAASLAVSTWLDATLTFELLGHLGSSTWWLSRALVAGLATLLVVGTAPERQEAVVAAASVWAWSLLLLAVPWSEDERTAIAYRGLDGASLSEVVECLGGRRCSVERWCREGPRARAVFDTVSVLEPAPLRDHDLDAVAFDFLYFWDFGGVHVTFPDGRARVSVNYD